MSLWIIYALISVVAGGIVSLIHRFILKKFDYASYGFLSQGIGAVIFLPLLLLNFNFPSQNIGWFILILGTITWSLAGILIFKSYQHLDISIRTPVYTLRLFFVALFAFLFLSESFPATKMIGTFLIIIGILFLNLRKKIFSFRDTGIRLTILASFVTSIAFIVDKIALSYFSPMMYGFFAYFGIALSLGLITSRKTSALKKLIKSKLRLVLISAIIDVVFYVTLLSALKLQEASVIFPFTQLGGLITVFGGILILKEKENISQKIIGSLLTILGALFVSGYLVV